MSRSQKTLKKQTVSAYYFSQSKVNVTQVSCSQLSSIVNNLLKLYWDVSGMKVFQSCSKNFVTCRILVAMAAKRKKSNIFFFEIIWSRALIVDMKHCLVDLQNNCLKNPPLGQKGARHRDHSVFYRNIEGNLKIIFFYL